ncbi:MAG: hypothetical protein Tsb0010_05020 [Parvularculaceae bacterium]
MGADLARAAPTEIFILADNGAGSGAGHLVAMASGRRAARDARMPQPVSKRYAKFLRAARSRRRRGDCKYNKHDTDHGELRSREALRVRGVMGGAPSSA